MMDDLEAQLAALHGEEGADSERGSQMGPNSMEVTPKKGHRPSDSVDAGAIFGEETPERLERPSAAPGSGAGSSSKKKKKVVAKFDAEQRNGAKGRPVAKPESTVPAAMESSPEVQPHPARGRKPTSDKKERRRRRRISSSTQSDDDDNDKGAAPEQPSTSSAWPPFASTMNNDGDDGNEEEEEEVERRKYVPKTYVQSCGLDRQKKAARAGFANAANANAVVAAGDSRRKTDDWFCCFCRRGNHFAGLGDLFGPHVVPKKYRSRCGHAELAPGEEIWFHHPCVYWAPGIYVPPTSGFDMPHGLLELMETSLSKLCVSCGDPGASLSCMAKKCDRFYHLPCAYAADCDLNDDTLHMFCRSHKNVGGPDSDVSPKSPVVSLPSFMDGSIWKLRL